MRSLRAMCGVMLTLALPRAQLSPVVIPADVERRLVAALGSDPFRALDDFASADKKVAEPALGKLQALGDVERIWLIRAGLRRGGAVALGAATAANGFGLHPDERRMAATLLMPRALGSEDRVLWLAFRTLLDAPLLDRLLAERPALPRDRDDLPDRWLPLVVPRHILHLVQMIWSDDVALRRSAMTTLETAALHSNQYREQIATAVLGWHDDDGDVSLDERRPLAIRRWERPPTTGGFPPPLVAVLRQALGEGLDERLQWTKVWSARWAIATEPAEADLPLLRDLLGRDDDVAVAIAARHVRRFPAADLPLREIAIARLARREWHRDGMVTARLLAHVAPERLRERGLRAGEGPELLVRLHCEPDATIAAWATTFREEPALQLDALTVLAEAAAAGRMDGMEIASEVWTRLRAELIAAELDEVAVEFALHELPVLRCKELCARHLETLSATTLGGERADALDALELYDATALRDRLRGFLGDDDEQVRHFAAWALLKLGDPESGVSMQEALATAEATGWGWWGQQSSPMLLAALSGRVGEQVPAGQGPERFAPLMALASARGLPARWCDRWAENLEGLEKPVEQQAWWTRLRGHLLAGEVDAAVTAWLRHDPAVGLQGLGSLRLPLAAEILRQRRECGPYRQWAVEELAVAGDASALAEIDAAIAAAQYDWIERMWPDVLVPRQRPERVAALVELLESNRAMVEVVRPLLDAMTRDRPFDIPATELQTRAENGRRWLRQFGGRLRWSTISGTFAIAPE